MIAPVTILQNRLLQVSLEPNTCSCFSDYPACLSIWSLCVAMCSTDPCLHLCSLFVQLYICLQGQLQYTPLFRVWLHICLKDSKYSHVLIKITVFVQSGRLVPMFQRNMLPPSFTLKKVAVDYYETLVPIYQTVQQHITIKKANLSYCWNLMILHGWLQDTGHENA